MINTRWTSWARFTYPLVLLIPGCSDEGTRSKVPVFEVRGEATYKGRPLGDVMVVLKPKESQPDVPAPTGRTDANGKFRLGTYLDGDGAPAGAYQVGFTVVRPNSDNRNLLQKVAPVGKTAIPAEVAAKYAKPENSGLTYEVKPGANEPLRISID